MTKEVMHILCGNEKILLTDFEFMPYQEEFVKTIAKANETLGSIVIRVTARATGRRISFCEEFNRAIYEQFVKDQKFKALSVGYRVIGGNVPVPHNVFKNNKNVQNTYGWYRSFEKKRFARGEE